MPPVPCRQLKRGCLAGGSPRCRPTDTSANLQAGSSDGGDDRLVSRRGAGSSSSTVRLRTTRGSFRQFDPKPDPPIRSAFWSCGSSSTAMSASMDRIAAAGSSASVKLPRTAWLPITRSSASCTTCEAARRMCSSWSRLTRIGPNGARTKSAHRGALCPTARREKESSGEGRAPSAFPR